MTPLVVQVRDLAGANVANTIQILSKLFYKMNTWELLWTRPKPSRQGTMSSSSSSYVENKTGAKPQNKGRAKRIRKTIENIKQFRLEVR